ncbi:MAG: lipoprotein signal peptidase [Ginsengibacter sp.]
MKERVGFIKNIKGSTVFFIIFLVVAADQLLKIYIKTHYYSGESHNVIGNWFKFYFIENEGMAYGMKFGGDLGKIILTLFRFAAVLFGVFYLRKIIANKLHSGFIICAALIFSGALGNLIDSLFYGMVFQESNVVILNVAKIVPGHGYAGFLHGKVVDMLYFPIIRGTFPQWVPIWHGEDFEFFRPIFNLADASISIGVTAILLFQKRFFKHITPKQTVINANNEPIVNEHVTIS